MLRRAVLAALLRAHSRRAIQRPFPQFPACCSQALQSSTYVAVRETPFSQQPGRCFSVDGATSAKVSESDPLPGPKNLIMVHELLRKLVPLFMTSDCLQLASVLDAAVTFDDSIFNYEKKGIKALMTHMAKVRTYFHISSPHKRTELLGSYIFEDKVVVLWRLKVMKTSILTYITRFIFRRDQFQVQEGALDLFVNAEGKVYKMLNRKVTPQDLVIAEKFAELKEGPVKQKSSSS